jgi:hypothetical protein
MDMKNLKDGIRYLCERAKIIASGPNNGTSEEHNAHIEVLQET